MQLDHEQLHRLLEALGESDIQEFRLEGDDFRLEIRRNLPAQAVMAPVMPAPVAAAPAPVAPAEPAAAPLHPPQPAVTARSHGSHGGHFYRAPAPGEPAFVEVGSRINVGQTVCILEAMKLMNELESEVGGEVVEILVDNGTPVEFGQVLMRVKPA